MLPEVAFLLRACIQSFHGFIYVPFYFQSTNTIKEAFCLRRELDCLMLLVTTLWQYLLFLDHFSASEGNNAMQEDGDHLSKDDDTILDHIVKVNKGKRPKNMKIREFTFCFF